MKILVVHNYYQNRGGEDAVCEAEIQLLRSIGHEIILYTRHNDEIHEFGLLHKIKLSWNTTWADRSHEEVRELIRRTSPDVAHFHNTFPLISPSAYYACAREQVPVVQTLHNFRLLCPGGNLFREGIVCESCLGHSAPLLGVIHACYRNSHSATAVVAGMLTSHHAMQTWRKKIDIYVALSNFARNKFIEGGLAPDKIVVKPNFVAVDPGSRTEPGDYALFVGRLSAEKGLGTLVAATQRLKGKVPVRVVGEGPLSFEIGSSPARFTMLGALSPADTLRQMLGARFLIAPSTCYENFPLVLAEAFACSLPVLASDHGATAEIVNAGQTGLLFKMGNPEDLADKMCWMWTNPQEVSEMGLRARAQYLSRYTAEVNQRMLTEIYSLARSRKSIDTALPNSAAEIARL